MRSLRIALAQMNSTVGDLDGNTDKIIRYIDEARKSQVDLVCFPGMAVTGYPPRDLLLKPGFIAANLERRDRIVENSGDIVVVFGFVDSADGLYNAAAVAFGGELAMVYHKTHLCRYPFFDEYRYFRTGFEPGGFVINGIDTEVALSEDNLGQEPFQSVAPPDLIVNLCATPFDSTREQSMEQALSDMASQAGVIMASVNLVGGQDEMVFDGGSGVVGKDGRVLAQGKRFEEELLIADLDFEAGGEPASSQTVISTREQTASKPSIPGHSVVPYGRTGEIYAALVLGTRDYIRKNGFPKALLGLSGGIDSALAAVIAVDAVGAGNVVGVAMPSQYSSQGSRDDAQLLAQNLGIALMNIPIEETFNTSLNMFSEQFAGMQPGVAEENLQARIRGNILMTLSNKFGWLVLNTGNRSEGAVGYCTLYGDMVGGFAVLKDVPKSTVYELSRYKNSQAGREVISQSIIDREPSAELSPGQRDVDSLPPYELLDPILEAYIGENNGLEEIVAMGFEREVVQKVMSKVDGNEYKRRQAPPGITLTPTRDWHLPMTNRFRGR
ncbi:MAG: NAD+ synthase [Chloroflexota bacterium]